MEISNGYILYFVSMRYFLLLLTCGYALTGNAQITGTWYATLNAGGQQIPLNIELELEDEEYFGTLQSPTQSPIKLSFSEVSVAGNDVAFTVSAADIRYTGRVVIDSIVGNFQQSTFSAPLTFYRTAPEGSRVSSASEPTPRPQDPTDFPYRRETITFLGGDSSVTLAGELTLPTDTPPKAMIVLVSGSGPQDRNQDLGPQINHRLFLVLSDYLTRRGYGVLRYDDRGVGESTGDFGMATSADFADDARGAVSYLQTHDDLKGIPVGMVGHSEGGMIAPMVAASGGLDFMILLAAPGHSIDSLMSDQRRQMSGGAIPYDTIHRAAYTYIKAHTDQDQQTFGRGLMDAMTSAEQSLVKDKSYTGSDADPVAGELYGTYASPWMRYFIAYEPAEYLRQVTVPVLAINGTLDRQVDVTNLDAIAEALDAAENNDVTIVVAPGLNHLLQPATTGMPGEYGQIETTVDESVMETIVEWLDERY